MIRRASGVLVVLLASAGAGVASAQPSASIAVVTWELPGVATELANDPGLVLHQLPGGPALSEIARPLTERARSAYREMEFAECAENAGSAVGIVEQRARTRGDFELLFDALVLRGMAELAQRDDERARASFLAAARLFPDRTLDEASHPPRVREAYDRARTEAEASPAPSRAATAPETDPAARVLALASGASIPAGERAELTAALRAVAVIRLEQTPHGAIGWLAFDGGPREAMTGEAASASAAISAARAALASEAVSLGGSSAVTATGPNGGTAGGVIADEGPVNDGLYLRLALAAAARGDSAQNMTLQANGAGLVFELEAAVGYTIAQRVAIAASFAAQIGNNAVTCPTTSTPAECNDPHVGPVGSLGLFVDWFVFGDGRLHIQASIGLARATLRGDGTALPETKALGFAAALGVGWEFWILDDIAVGPLLRLSGYRVAEGDVAVGGLAISLGLSLTYN